MWRISDMWRILDFLLYIAHRLLLFIKQHCCFLLVSSNNCRVTLVLLKEQSPVAEWTDLSVSFPESLSTNRGHIYLIQVWQANANKGKNQNNSKVHVPINMVYVML